MDRMQYSGMGTSLSDRERRAIEQADRKRKANSGFYPRIYLEVASEDFIGDFDLDEHHHGKQCDVCHSTARYISSGKCIHCHRRREADRYALSKEVAPDE